MVKVSTSAKDKLTSLMAEEGKSLETTYISVGVESGGCSGLSYKMEFTPDMPENAELYEDNGVKVVVREKVTPLPYRHHFGIQRRPQWKRIQF
jgi:iron-sulfur cluster assembly protein